jgi:hypothetical protein
MSFWDDFLANLTNGAGTPQAGNPTGLGPPGVTMNSTPAAPAPSGANTALLNPASAAINNIYNTSASTLAAAHRAAAAMRPSTWGQQISDAGAIEGGNPAVAQPVSSGQNPAPTLPQPTYTLPPFTAHARPAAAAPPAGGGGTPPYGSPWDPQGVGYAKSWDPQGVAAAAAARMSGAPQGVLAAQQPNSPFTMVLRPNAPANNQGGRGGGGPALSTALDLSGYRPAAAAPPAPANINLGYGGPAPPSAAVSPRARAQVPPKNPFTGWGVGTASPLKGNPWNVVPGNPYPFTGGGV